jgi:hypothetical protein
MRRVLQRVAFGATLALGAFALFIACSSAGPRYPACERDDQCALSGKHDYCVAGKCVYCRTEIDCGERERCRAGKCEVDPNAPIPRLDAGSDAEDADAEPDDDANTEPTEPTERAAPPHVIPRGVRRFLRP